MRENLTSGSTGGAGDGAAQLGHLRVSGRCAEKRHHNGLVGTQPAGHLQPRQRPTLHGRFYDEVSTAVDFVPTRSRC